MIRVLTITSTAQRIAANLLAGVGAGYNAGASPVWYRPSTNAPDASDLNGLSANELARKAGLEVLLPGRQAPVSAPWLDVVAAAGTVSVLLSQAGPVVELADPAFGDGSDGDKHVTADETMTQAEYNLASLTIDAGATWLGGDCADVGANLTIIRCQTPIVINGAIRAGKSGLYDWSIPGWLTVSSGQPPVEVLASGTFYGPPNLHVLPIVGGGGTAGTAYACHSNGSDVAVGHILGSVVAGAAGDTAMHAQVAVMVGRDRRYKHCAGGAGGMGATAPGGAGAAAVILIAPAILFGAAGAIHADGAAGQHVADLDETDPENPIAADQGGGGGGGYLELCTRVPIATADRAKCTANGGAAGGASAGAGATGVVRFYSV